MTSGFFSHLYFVKNKSVCGSQNYSGVRVARGVDPRSSELTMDCMSDQEDIVRWALGVVAGVHRSRGGAKHARACAGRMDVCGPCGVRMRMPSMLIS